MALALSCRPGNAEVYEKALTMGRCHFSGVGVDLDVVRLCKQSNSEGE